MNDKNLADKLREYNQWRRGADMPQPDPKELGKLIDDAAERIEELEKELVVIKSAAESFVAAAASYNQSPFDSIAIRRYDAAKKKLGDI